MLLCEKNMHANAKCGMLWPANGHQMELRRSLSGLHVAQKITSRTVPQASNLEVHMEMEAGQLRGCILE